MCSFIRIDDHLGGAEREWCLSQTFFLPATNLRLKPDLHRMFECSLAGLFVEHIALLRDADVLRLGEEAQGFFAAFAADATLFHPAKGNAQVAHQPAIHPYRAGIDLFSDAMGATEVLCPDA